VSRAVGTTAPDTPFTMRSGVALSMYFVIERSWMQADGNRPFFVLPVPVDVPHDQARTSISSWCTLSSDSPLMLPILRNMSVAAATTPLEANRPATTTPALSVPFHTFRLTGAPSFRCCCVKMCRPTVTDQLDRDRWATETPAAARDHDRAGHSRSATGAVGIRRRMRIHGRTWPVDVASANSARRP
jgi:hypothetical protein